jgi:hypothetical protein
VVEGAPLLREYTGNGIEGSNPFFSAILHLLVEIPRPLLVPVPHADDEDVVVLFDLVDDEMGLERVNAHWRRYLKAFPRHAWIGGDQAEDGKQLVMVPPGLCRSEQARTFLGNADNIFFSLERKATAHS